MSLGLFKYNEPFCNPCELTMNSLRGVCQRQGALAWYNEQRCCEKKSKALITNYRTHKKLVDAGEKSGRWLVASAKEELSATQEADYVDRGRLMDKTAYIKWCTTDKPGKKKGHGRGQGGVRSVGEGPRFLWSLLGARR